MASEIEMFAQSLANEIAVFARQQIYWETPYRNGFLRDGRSSIGQVIGAVPYKVSFSLLTPETQYGAILNEYPIIYCKRVNARTNKVSEWSYPNKHYGWVDRAAEKIANDIPINFPNVRRII